MITDVVSRRRRRIYRQRRIYTATDATRICNYMAILLVLLCFQGASMLSPNITEEYWYLAMIARMGHIGGESYRFRNKQARLPMLGWQYRVAYALWGIAARGGKSGVSKHSETCLTIVKKKPQRVVEVEKEEEGKRSAMIAKRRSAVRVAEM
eukprot:3243423-Pleurochrysis_carterae.AAC.1